MLASSFINTRFRPAAAAEEAAAAHWTPRDELPFLDTDLARATVLLTYADYAFFCDEHGIALPAPPAPPARPPAYVVVQLVELGGDHIDLMMRPSAAVPPALREVAVRSRALLRAVAHVVYFVNATALLTKDNAHAAAVDALRRKLAFVARVLQDADSGNTGRVLFAISRVPEDDDRAPEPVEERFARVLETELPREAAALRWCRADCFAVHHLTPSGALDATGVLTTFARLLSLAPVRCVPPDASRKQEQQEQRQEKEGEAGVLVVPHVVRAACARRGEWLTAAAMREEAEEMAHRGAGVDCPAPVVVQEFAPVCRALAARHALLLHRGESHGDIAVTLVPSNNRNALALHWQPREAEGTFAARLPVLAALRDAVAGFVDRNVPAALWFTGGADAEASEAAALPPREEWMRAPLAECLSVVEDTLAALADALTPARGVDDAGVCAVWHAAVTALEDYCLGWAFAHGTAAEDTTFAWDARAATDAGLARLAALTGMTPTPPAHAPRYRAVIKLL